MEGHDKFHWPAELTNLPDWHSPWGIYYEERGAMLSPTMHWCFLAEVAEKVQFIVRPRVLVRTASGKRHVVHFYHERNEEPTTFNWSQLVPGATLAIMYAKCKDMMDGTLGIRQEHLNSVFVFKATLSEVNDAILWRNKPTLSTVTSKCNKQGCSVTDKLSTSMRYASMRNTAARNIKLTIGSVTK